MADNTEQQITIRIHDGVNNIDKHITVVYAKCTSTERKDLSSDLDKIHQLVDGAWCIGGDFNVILDLDEKL